MIVGIDIGHTNIKIACSTLDEFPAVRSASFSFSTIGGMIEKLVSFVPHPDIAVVTQTICASRYFFSSLKKGTYYIVDLTEKLFGEKVRYPSLSYKLYSPEEAKNHYLDVSCRNWAATCYLATYFNLLEEGLVIDCGTISTDIVPILSSAPVTLDDNDHIYTRLKTGELFWSGLYFTHLYSISDRVVLDCEEFLVNPFARTMIFDAYVILGIISPEEVIAKFSDLHDRSFISFESCVDRMLDTIAADRELLTANDAKKIAQFFVEKQREKTKMAIKKVLSDANKKYKTDLKVAAIAGAGKDIILGKILDDSVFDEIIDIEKAASEILDLETSQSNCETSLGCALMGLELQSRSS
jgi:probable H4MPT-linked C1 transfer pathway protein